MNSQDMSTKAVQDVKAVWGDNEDKTEIGQSFPKVKETIKSILTALVTERHKDADLDYLINTTEALVSSNNEIWDRCKANLHHENEKFNQLSKNPVLRFKRFGFNEVKVLSTRKHKLGQSQGLLVLETRCDQQTMSFSVTCLPHPLHAVFIPALGKNGMLNYSAYLKRSFILEESILLPFLAILKDHLEEFQVFLGNVESWLMGSTQSAIFLLETFNVGLEVVTTSNLTKNEFDDTCIHCGESTSSRRSKARKVVCPGGEVCNVYKRSVTVLKSIASSEDINLSFDVSVSTGQERLIKFLAFLTHPISEPTWDPSLHCAVQEIDC